MLTSFIPASIYQKIGQPNNYYFSTLRFPELLIGSLLAIFLQSDKVKNPSDKPHSVIALVSFILLILCLVFYHKDFIFIPGIALILPCGLAALLIYATTQPNLTQRLLSHPIFVFIGKISYSLYLYHWIFISFAYYITGAKQIGINETLIIILATFICSILSYYLIEQPIRKSKLTFKQSFILLYLIPSVILIAYNLVSNKRIKKEKLHIEQDIAFVDSSFNFPAKILLIGDSHAGHLESFLDYVGSQEGWNSESLSLTDGKECFVLVDEQNQISPTCQTLFDQIIDPKYKAIFFSGFYDLRMGGKPVPRFEAQSFAIPDFKQRFKESIKKIAELKPVYVFADNSSMSRSPIREHMLKKYGLEKFLEPIRPMGDIKASNQEIYQLIKDIPNVHWVDAQQYLPQNAVMAEGQYLYGDQDHLTAFGSYYMGREFHKHQRLLTPEQVAELYR